MVGESDDLQKRLFSDHYLRKFSNPFHLLLGTPNKTSGDLKEIWDFSKEVYSTNDINLIYNDLHVYDAIKTQPKYAKAASLKHLLFFQDARFFNTKHGIPGLSSKSNKKIEESFYYLMKLGGSCSPSQLLTIGQNAAHLLLTLRNFTNNFYFLYTAENSENKDFYLSKAANRKHAEYVTKQKLQLIDIYTTASAKPHAGPSLTINLDRVKNELINTGTHKYNTPSGAYKNSLHL